MTEPSPTQQIARNARRTVEIERDGLGVLAAALADGAVLSETLVAVVAAIRAAPGRVVLSGMGKSGHVARKIAATLASTGTPASFVHPAEASHGDLGMIGAGDLVLALSNSGETRELSDIVNYCARFDIPLAAITSGQGSSLAKAADYLLLLPAAEEACSATRKTDGTGQAKEDGEGCGGHLILMIKCLGTKMCVLEE